ncbi:MAG TPA: hypothetical protein ENI70_00460 [Candidatus Peregrinibacteria bacterium]|nr:hypothetical protein [Candidatus Peregrinibacteria bacterium]
MVEKSESSEEKLPSKPDSTENKEKGIIDKTRKRIEDIFDELDESKEENLEDEDKKEVREDTPPEESKTSGPLAFTHKAPKKRGFFGRISQIFKHPFESITHPLKTLGTLFGREQEASTHFQISKEGKEKLENFQRMKNVLGTNGPPGEAAIVLIYASKHEGVIPKKKQEKLASIIINSRSGIGAARELIQDKGEYLEIEKEQLDRLEKKAK